MLKIKDNVSLEELEKFGFEAALDDNQTKVSYHLVNPQTAICVYLDRTFKIFFTPRLSYYVNGSEFEVLFDLIQAGLVEKV